VVGFPTDSNAVSENSPQTVAVKLPQLAFEESAIIRQRETQTKEAERKRMDIQGKYGSRHDRVWTISQKDDQKKDIQSS
jgi:hypothetical protein